MIDSAPPRPVHHAGPCGLRIRSPHPACQDWAGPNYNPAELRATTLTSGPARVRVLWIVCHGCGTVRQASEATA